MQEREGEFRSKRLRFQFKHLFSSHEGIRDGRCCCLFGVHYDAVSIPTRNVLITAKNYGVQYTLDYSIKPICIYSSYIFILLPRQSDQSVITSSHRSCRPSTTQNGGIPLSAFPNGTTSKLTGLVFTLSLLMLSVKRGSCEYQF